MSQITSKPTGGVAGLKKHDIKVSGIVFMIYCLVAAGAFGIEEMIPESGPGMTMILLVVFPIIWAYPISNMVAEMGSVLPSEGGVYVWVREAFGEFWGFQAGWWSTVSTYITNGTYVALVAGYASQVLPMSELSIVILKIGMILIFTIINLMGLKEVGTVSSVLSVLILLAFGLITIVGIVNWNTNPVQPIVPEGKTLLQGIGGGISICIWMYCGYECISNMAGEVKNPQIIPKGLMIAMPLIALTYILPTMGGLASLEGSWENWATTEDAGMSAVGYASVLTKYLGQSWGYIFLVVAILAQCAIFNTYLASGSRGFFVLADDHLCPKVMTKVSRKRGVPYVGVLSLAVVTLLLTQFSFTTLVKVEVVFMLALYIILSLAIIKLRKILPVKERKARGLYVMPGGNKGLVFFAGSPLFVAVLALLIGGADNFVIGLIGVCSGLIFYLIFKWTCGGLYRRDPEIYPINVKTKLAFGDLLRIGHFGIITGLFAVVGRFIIIWYEGEGAQMKYAQEAESSFFSNFEAMMNGLLAGGLLLLAMGIVFLFAGRKLEADGNKSLKPQNN